MAPGGRHVENSAVGETARPRSRRSIGHRNVGPNKGGAGFGNRPRNIEPFQPNFGWEPPAPIPADDPELASGFCYLARHVKIQMLDSIPASTTTLPASSTASLSAWHQVPPRGSSR